MFYNFDESRNILTFIYFIFRKEQNSINEKDRQGNEVRQRKTDSIGEGLLYSPFLLSQVVPHSGPHLIILLLRPLPLSCYSLDALHDRPPDPDSEIYSPGARWQPPGAPRTSWLPVYLLTADWPYLLRVPAYISQRLHVSGCQHIWAAYTHALRSSSWVKWNILSQDSLFDGSLKG